MNRKRFLTSSLLGALLGIFCIVGVGMRHGFTGNYLFLFATWYNRLIMGAFIGLAGDIKLAGKKYNTFLRGLMIGIFISAGLHFSTGFRDPPSMIAGMLYGVVIDTVATKRKTN